MNSFEKALALFEKNSGRLRTSEAIRLGISPRTLYTLRDTGKIEEVTRGYFQLPNMTGNEHADLIQIALRVPRGVICLISALAYHHLTTQIPHMVYLALPLDAEKPRIGYPPVKLVWLSPGSYTAGKEVHLIDGVKVPVYDREKTIADCFKYRNKIGINIALEALKDGLSQGCKPERVLEYSRIDRVEKVIRPYLEALT
jgi:predicted transcriptional regulator of viral defense system